MRQMADAINVIANPVNNPIHSIVDIQPPVLRMSRERWFQSSMSEQIAIAFFCLNNTDVG